MSATAEYVRPIPEVNPWLIAATVISATFMEVLDTSVANVSLPHIAGSLSAGVDESTWVLTSYLVSNAIVLPLTGWFSTLFGRKRFFLACVVIFTLSSFLCGMAPSLGALVFFRVIQGAGGGGMQPISQAILVDSFPRGKQGMAMAIYGMGVVVAPTLGPTLGGWITDNYSWRWIFLLNVPVGIISVLMISLLISDPAHLVRKTFKQGLRIDFLGLGLLSVGLGFLQVILDKGERDDWFGSTYITWATVVCVAALIALVIRELTAQDPVVDVHLFKDRNFAISTFMMYTLGVVLYGTTLLVPIWLQTLMGYTAMESGMVLLPGGLVAGHPAVRRSAAGPFRAAMDRCDGIADHGDRPLSTLASQSKRRDACAGERLDYLPNGHRVFVRADQRDGVLLRPAWQNEQRLGSDQSRAKHWRKHGHLFCDDDARSPRAVSPERSYRKLAARKPSLPSRAAPFDQYPGRARGRCGSCPNAGAGPRLRGDAAAGHDACVRGRFPDQRHDLPVRAAATVSDERENPLACARPRTAAARES